MRYNRITLIYTIIIFIKNNKKFTVTFQDLKDFTVTYRSLVRKLICIILVALMIGILLSEPINEDNIFPSLILLSASLYFIKNVLKI